MGTTIKRVFLTTLLLCSLLYISLPNLAYAEDQKGKESTTENVGNNGDVAEPPSGPNTTIDTETQEVEIETPASVTGKKVDGTGTVTDFSTNGSKAFYTITDNEQKVFYLIVDLDKTNNNVYFLSDVNKSQLEGTVEQEAKENVQPVPVAPPPIESEKEEKSKEGGSNSFLLMVLLVSAAVVGVYYFRMKKKKEQGNTEDEDEDEMNEDYEEDDVLHEDNMDKKDNKDDK